MADFSRGAEAVLDAGDTSPYGIKPLLLLALAGQRSSVLE
jgi:hypothetical protein